MNESLAAHLSFGAPNVPSDQFAVPHPDVALRQDRRALAPMMLKPVTPSIYDHEHRERPGFAVKSDGRAAGGSFA